MFRCGGVSAREGRGIRNGADQSKAAVAYVRLEALVVMNEQELDNSLLCGRWCRRQLDAMIILQQSKEREKQNF